MSALIVFLLMSTHLTSEFFSLSLGFSISLLFLIVDPHYAKFPCGCYSFY